jgi:hypothetical protein
MSTIMRLCAIALSCIFIQCVCTGASPSTVNKYDRSPLDSAESEEEILSWAKPRHDYVRSEYFTIDGMKVFVLLASPPTATSRMNIYVYNVYEPHGFSLLLVRYAHTSKVTIRADEKDKQLEFRSKGGKVLLILPIDKIDRIFDEKES